MQITLKQSEIETALKNYINQCGVSLANKTITVAFTAGRKESGISAELDIDDTPLTIPGYETADETDSKTHTKGALSVVAAPVTTAAAFAPEPKETPVEPTEEDEPVVATASKNSLFS